MGGKGSGNRNFSPENTDGELNSRSIGLTRALMHLPKIDLGDPKAIDERMDEYFTLCERYQIRPLVGNYALALGLDKRTLAKLLFDETSGVRLGVTAETKGMLKSYYAIIEQNFEQMLVGSKTPVAGIYYTKAMFGWRETPNETVITHRSEKPQLTESDKSKIASKYKAIAGVDDFGATYELPEGE